MQFGSLRLIISTLQGQKWAVRYRAFLVSREIPHPECTRIEAEMWPFPRIDTEAKQCYFREPPRGRSWHVSPPPAAFRSELSKSELVTLARSQSTVHSDGSNKITLWLAVESSCVQDEKGPQKYETFSGVYFGCLFTATKSASIILRTPYQLEFTGPIGEWTWYEGGWYFNLIQSCNHAIEELKIWLFSPVGWTPWTVTFGRTLA